MQLIKVLSDNDKNIIRDYITLNEVKADEFIGVDEWLKYWSTDKYNMYRLLGKELTISFPIEKHKSIDEMIREFDNMEFKQAEIDGEDRYNHYTISAYLSDLYDAFFYNWDPDTRKSVCVVNLSYDLLSREKDYIDDTDREDRNLIHQREIINNPYINVNVKHAIMDLFKNERIANGTVLYRIKYQIPNKKILQINKGEKVMKAIRKLISYFEITKYNVDKNFNEFRDMVSTVTMDKIIKTDMYLSIHPMNFLTMSDNNNGWSSCMSWTTHGCYHTGTVEMMNSNCVIVAYIKSDREDYEIGGHTWNNKKWRQLVYVTKNMILTGKSYPFENSGLSNDILSFVRDLAEKNLGWHYGDAERYTDMAFIKPDETSYHEDLYENIFNYTDKTVFITNLMYNDMLNDWDYPYYCCKRIYEDNSPKPSLRINLSGKCNCVKCNGTVLDYKEYDIIDDFNDFFVNTGAVYCEDCITDKKCFECGDVCFSDDLKEITLANGESLRICNECLMNDIKICPCCGGYFRINMDEGKDIPVITTSTDLEHIYYRWGCDIRSKSDLEEFSNAVMVLMHMCSECYDKKKNNGEFSTAEKMGYKKEDIVDNPDRPYWYVARDNVEVYGKIIDANDIFNSEIAPYLLMNIKNFKK